MKYPIFLLVLFIITKCSAQINFVKEDSTTLKKANYIIEGEFYVFNDSIYSARTILQEWNWQKRLNNSKERMGTTINIYKKMVKNDSIFNYIKFWGLKGREENNADIQILINYFLFDETIKLINKSFPEINNIPILRNRDKKLFKPVQKPTLIVVESSFRDNYHTTINQTYEDLKMLKNEFNSDINVVLIMPYSRSKAKEIARKNSLSYIIFYDSKDFIEDQLKPMNKMKIIILNNKGIVKYVSNIGMKKGDSSYDYKEIKDYINHLM